MTDTRAAATGIEALTQVTSSTLLTRAAATGIEVLTSIPTGPVITTMKSEILINGTWIDVSAYVEVREGVVITHDATEAGSTVAPTTMTLALRNAPDPVTGICIWTPDNQLSPYYPGFTRDCLIRFSYSRTPNSWVRFLGWVDAIEPDVPDGAPSQALVRITASDILSRYARRTMLSEFGEKALQLQSGAVPSASSVDYWPFDDEPDAVYLRNEGLPATGRFRAKVIPPKGTAKGTLSLGTPDAAVLIDGAATLARGDGLANAPVVLTQMRKAGGYVRQAAAWTQLPGDPTGSYDDLCTGWTADGTMIWRLGPAVDLVSGNVIWQLRDGATGTVTSAYDTGTSNDEQWRWVGVRFDSDGRPLATVRIRDRYMDPGGGISVSGAYTDTYGWDGRTDTAWITWGGNMSPFARGKQVNTMNGSFGGVSVVYTTGPTDGFSATFTDYAVAGLTLTAQDRAALLAAYGLAYDTLVGGGVGDTDPDTTPMQLVASKSRTLLDLWTEHKDTVGGVLATLPDGRRKLRVKTNSRPAATALTLSVVDDLHMPAGGFVWRKREKPTRVTATGPVGSHTAVDAAAEATGLRLDGPDIQTAAGDISVVESAAGSELAGSDRARATSFGLDPRLTLNDVWVALFGLAVGDRLALTDLDSGMWGHTSEQVYARGWSETYGGEEDDPLKVWFVFDAEPADDPSEAVWDDATYGRWAMGDGAATVTGGTAVGATGTGTIVVTSTSPLTTTAGSYPMNLDWLGECVTVGSAPASSTSPQTLTITARGLNGTVARAHAAGEAIDVWLAARWAR